MAKVGTRNLPGGVDWCWCCGSWVWGLTQGSGRWAWGRGVGVGVGGWRRVAHGLGDIKCLYQPTRFCCNSGELASGLAAGVGELGLVLEELGSVGELRLMLGELGLGTWGEGAKVGVEGLGQLLGELRLVSWGCDPGVNVGELGWGGLMLGEMGGIVGGAGGYCRRSWGCAVGMGATGVGVGVGVGGSLGLPGPPTTKLQQKKPPAPRICVLSCETVPLVPCRPAAAQLSTSSPCPNLSLPDQTM